MPRGGFNFPTSSDPQFDEVRSGSSTRGSDPEYLYYNSQIINNSTSTTSTVNDPIIRFQDTRSVPILQDKSKYAVSVSNFTINGAGKGLPVMIPQIRQYNIDGSTNRNPNNTVYDITFTAQYGGLKDSPSAVYQSTRAVQWEPENQATWTTQPAPIGTYSYPQPEIDYYYCYTYAHWVKLVNKALALAWNDVLTAAKNGSVSGTTLVVNSVDGDFVKGQTIVDAQAGATGIVVNFSGDTLVMYNITGVFNAGDVIFTNPAITGTIGDSNPYQTVLKIKNIVGEFGQGLVFDQQTGANGTFVSYSGNTLVLNDVSGTFSSGNFIYQSNTANAIITNVSQSIIVVLASVTFKRGTFVVGEQVYDQQNGSAGTVRSWDVGTSTLILDSIDGPFVPNDNIFYGQTGIAAITTASANDSVVSGIEFGTKCPFYTYDAATNLFSLWQDSNTCVVPYGSRVPAPSPLTAFGISTAPGYLFGEYSFIGYNTNFEALMTNFDSTYYSDQRIYPPSASGSSPPGVFITSPTGIETTEQDTAITLNKGSITSFNDDQMVVTFTSVPISTEGINWTFDYSLTSSQTKNNIHVGQTITFTLNNNAFDYAFLNQIGLKLTATASNGVVVVCQYNELLTGPLRLVVSVLSTTGTTGKNWVFRLSPINSSTIATPTLGVPLSLAIDEKPYQTPLGAGKAVTVTNLANESFDAIVSTYTQTIDYTGATGGSAGNNFIYTNASAEPGQFSPIASFQGQSGLFVKNDVVKGLTSETYAKIINPIQGANSSTTSTLSIVDQSAPFVLGDTLDDNGASATITQITGPNIVPPTVLHTGIATLAPTYVKTYILSVSSIVVGKKYQIEDLGEDTDWAALGVSGTAEVGTIFTASKSGGLGTGQVFLVNSVANLVTGTNYVIAFLGTTAWGELGVVGTAEVGTIFMASGHGLGSGLVTYATNIQYSGPFAIGDTVLTSSGQALISNVSGSNGVTTLSYSAQKNPFVIGHTVDCYASLADPGSAGNPQVCSGIVTEIIGDNLGYGVMEFTNQNGKFGIGESVVDNNTGAVATIVAVTGDNNGYAYVSYINQLTTGAPGAFIPGEFLLLDGVAFAQVVIDKQNVLNQTEGNIGTVTCITGKEIGGVFYQTADASLPGAGASIQGSTSGTTADYGGTAYLDSGTLTLNNFCGTFYVGDFIVDSVGYGLASSRLTTQTTATCNGVSYTGSGKLVLKNTKGGVSAPGTFPTNYFIVDVQSAGFRETTATNPTVLQLTGILPDDQFYQGNSISQDLGGGVFARGTTILNNGPFPFGNPDESTQLITVLYQPDSPSFELGGAPIIDSTPGTYLNMDKTNSNNIPTGFFSQGDTVFQVISSSPVSISDLSAGLGYVIHTVGTSNFTLIGASANAVGTYFIASDRGVGDGTVYACRTANITTVVPSFPSFPTRFNVTNLVPEGTSFTNSGTITNGTSVLTLNGTVLYNFLPFGISQGGCPQSGEQIVNWVNGKIGTCIWQQTNQTLTISTSAGEFVAGDVVRGNTTFTYGVVVQGSAISTSQLVVTAYNGSFVVGETLNNLTKNVTPSAAISVVITTPTTSLIYPGNLDVGTQYKIVSSNATDWTTVGSSVNTIGHVFTATNSGTPGTVYQGVTPGSFLTGSSYTIDQANSTDFTKIGSANNTTGTTFTATNSGKAGTGFNILNPNIMSSGNQYVILTTGSTDFTNLGSTSSSPGTIYLQSQNVLSGQVYDSVNVSSTNPLVNGTEYYISVPGTVNWTAIGAASSAVGTKFTYNNVAITGTAGEATSKTLSPVPVSAIVVSDRYYIIFDLGCTNWTYLGYSGTPEVDGTFRSTHAGTSGTAAIIQTVSAGSFTVGSTYIIQSVGSTNFTAIGASANTVGTVFVATGIGSGSGTAYIFTNTTASGSFPNGSFGIASLGSTNWASLGYVGTPTVGTTYTNSGVGTLGTAFDSLSNTASTILKDSRYKIDTLGSTAWSYLGVSGTPTVGTRFTATKSGTPGVVTGLNNPTYSYSTQLINDPINPFTWTTGDQIGVLPYLNLPGKVTQPGQFVVPSGANITLQYGAFTTNSGLEVGSVLSFYNTIAVDDGSGGTYPILSTFPNAIARIISISPVTPTKRQTMSVKFISFGLTGPYNVNGDHYIPEGIGAGDGVYNFGGDKLFGNTQVTGGSLSALQVPYFNDLFLQNYIAEISYYTTGFTALEDYSQVQVTNASAVITNQSEGSTTQGLLQNIIFSTSSGFLQTSSPPTTTTALTLTNVLGPIASGDLIVDTTTQSSWNITNIETYTDTTSTQPTVVPTVLTITDVIGDFANGDVITDVGNNATATIQSAAVNSGKLILQTISGPGFETDETIQDLGTSAKATYLGSVKQTVTDLQTDAVALVSADNGTQLTFESFSGTFNVGDQIQSYQLGYTADLSGTYNFAVGDLLTQPNPLDFQNPNAATVVSDDGTQLVVKDVTGDWVTNSFTDTTNDVTATATNISGTTMVLIPLSSVGNSGQWIIVPTKLTSSTSVVPVVGEPATFTTNLTATESILQAGDLLAAIESDSVLTVEQLYYPENVVEVDLSSGNGSIQTIQSLFPSAGTGTQYVVLVQDMESTSSLWSPVASIVIGTQFITVREEYSGTPVTIGSANLGSNATTGSFQKVLLETPIEVLPQESWRGILSYEPRFEKLSSLGLSKEDLKNLDIQVYWRNRLTNSLTPLALYNGGSANIRLMFKRIHE